MYLNSNYSYIIDYLSKKIKIEEKFNNWLTIKKDYYNSMTIAPRELNERYKLLAKPFDTYCKQNYIDFNFIVDQILQMSLPYSEGKQNTDKYATLSNEHTLYEPSTYQVKQHELPQGGLNQNFIFATNKDQTQNVTAPQMNFFSNNIENNQNYLQKSAEPTKPILPDNNTNNILPIINRDISPQLNINLNRNDSLNNFLRDGSFYNWENNNERFLPSRGGSQLFGQFPEDMQDDAKIFFAKSNPYRNVSVQSVVNELSPPQNIPLQPNLPYISNFNAKTFSPELINKENNENEDNIDKGEINQYVDNKAISFGKESSEKDLNSSIIKQDSSNTTPFIQSGNKPLLKLEFSGADPNVKNLNLFKKMREEQKK